MSVIWYFYMYIQISLRINSYVESEKVVFWAFIFLDMTVICSVDHYIIYILH